MRGLGKRGSQEASDVDAELNARLSRLRSELVQARRQEPEGNWVDSALGEAERRLEEAGRLADETHQSNQAGELKDQCLRVVQEVEAELCMLKPAELLYPTWTRLRENLYRFDKGRREAWEADIAEHISADVAELEPDRLRSMRQRLRQLTLELRESALRFNRLNEERAAVTRDVMKLGVSLLCLFGALVAACLTFSTWTAPCAASTLVLLVASISAGGMGAVFSRFGARRDERQRQAFKGILKWDMGLHVCIGSGAALLVAAVLLSERIFPLPQESTARAAYLVVLGFGAGFSDRLFKVMLSQVIGTRRSSRDGE